MMMEEKMDTSPKYKKGFLRSLILALAFCFGLGYSVSAATNGQSDAFTRTYHWEFEGCEYSMEYQFPWETYHFYQEKPRVFHNYAVYAFENKHYAFLPEFVRQMECMAEDHGLDRAGTLRLVIAFVQQLEYRGDQGEYPKFPIETLAEFGGDCEDTSILLAAMLEAMGYSTVLINPPGHMAIAMACEDCEGVAYHQDGRRYYYIETTAAGFGIGEVPGDYQQTTDKIMPMTVKAVDLWVLHEFIPKKAASGDMLYYVSEDEGVMAKSQRGESYMATTTWRSVQMDGKVSTSRSIEISEQ
jgi:hypothetical protein